MENTNYEPKQCVVPRVGKSAPPFYGKAVINGSVKKIDIRDFVGKYVILMFCDEDFFEKPPPEVIGFITNYDVFNRVNSEIIVCSTESVYCHRAWLTLQRKLAGFESAKIILLSDKNSNISKNYGVYEESSGFCQRALFVIDRTTILRHVTINDNKIGLSVNEVLRIIYEMENIAFPVDTQKRSLPKDMSLNTPKIATKESTTNATNQQQEPMSKVITEKTAKNATRTLDSLIEENRPTELRVSKRAKDTQQIQYNRPKDVNYNNVATCEVPDYLLNGVRVEINITDKTKDTFTVYVENKLRASIVKPTIGGAHIVFNENCSIRFVVDKIIIKFATDEVIIQILHKDSDLEITIDQMTVKKKVENNYAFISIEANCKTNHLLCINGQATRLNATDATEDKQVYDYTDIQQAGNIIIYYRKFK